MLTFVAGFMIMYQNRNKLMEKLNLSLLHSVHTPRSDCVCYRVRFHFIRCCFSLQMWWFSMLAHNTSVKDIVDYIYKKKIFCWWKSLKWNSSVYEIGRNVRENLKPDVEVFTWDKVINYLSHKEIPLKIMKIQAYRQIKLFWSCSSAVQFISIVIWNYEFNRFFHFIYEVIFI